MGKLDRSFAEGNAAGDEVGVWSRRGFLRYTKHYNSKGKRKHGRFSMRAENREDNTFRVENPQGVMRAD